MKNIYPLFSKCRIILKKYTPFKMKSIYFFLILINTILPFIANSQGVDCSTADPFCTGTTYTFPNSTSTTSQSGPDYGCLLTQPNPAWYYLQIANSGSIDIHIAQADGGGSGIDVDFICWGPFASSTGACTGSLTAANTVDCSYSAAATEDCNIPNGVTGQFYLLLLTNYSGVAGTITFSQTGGAGSTDCSILAPPITNNGPLCVGQTLNLTVTNPTAGATYNWTGPNGFTSTAMNPTIPNVTTANAGTYSLTITVGGVTSAPVTTTVVINTNPVADAGPPQAICAGTSATLTASGGGTYQWSSPPGSATATASITPAATATYTVTVTSNGCTGTDNVVVTVNPLPVAAITSTTPATCGMNNGSATASGGVSYLWSDSQTTATASNLASAIYTVTVTDANGCTASGSANVTSTSAPTATASSTNETCGQSNGTATVTPGGACGTGFTYLWNTMPAQSSAIATNLPAGNYTVTVSCSGCTATATTTVTNLAGPSVSISGVINATCSMSNASATATASGGTPNYNYQWNSIPAQYTQNLVNVPAGNYIVSATDANGCIATNSVIITSTPGITTSITSFTNEDCGQSDGTATASVNGGNAPYVYQWNTNPVQSTSVATNIPTGTYTVTATDAAGCTASTTVTIITINIPTASATSTNEFCGNSDGTATVTASGGSGNYSYLWNNGQTLQTATGLAAGSYTVTVSDNFCTATATTFVTGIPGPNAGFSCSPQVLTMMDGPVSFLDNSSGNIVNWLWNYGDGSVTGSGANNSHMYSNLGTYLVTLVVTDNNGCMDTVQDTVKVKEIYTIYIPNAFTPNEDFINDLFFPQGINIDPNEYEMTIFDRWGKLVFKSTKYGEGWNGTLNNKGDVKKVVMDAYVYRIKIKEVDGPKHEYIGRVSLIP